MVIGIDASRAVLGQKTGTENYSFNLIRSLAKIDQRNQYFLYLNQSLNQVGVFRERLGLSENFEIKSLPCPRFWTQIRLASEMLWHKKEIDVLFIPSHTIPWIHPKNTVVTIHGLEYEYFPDAYSRFDLWHLRQTTKLATVWAKKIITVSKNTKKDLIKFYKTKPEQIEVVYHGVGDLSQDQINLSKVKLLQPYIFFIGRLEARKNLVRLIDAFGKLKKEKKIPHKLVLAGKPGFGFEEISKAIKKFGLDKDIILLGFISDREKLGFFKGAHVFVFPSLYEGFGMPLLEAMKAGVPCACSKIPSLSEIGGEAVLYFDPEDPGEIARVIWEVLSDSNLREKMIRKGQNRAADFSWEKCAKETLEVLKKATK